MTKRIESIDYLLWWENIGCDLYTIALVDEFPELDAAEIDKARQQFLQDLAEEIYQEYNLWN